MPTDLRCSVIEVTVSHSDDPRLQFLASGPGQRHQHQLKLLIPCRCTGAGDVLVAINNSDVLTLSDLKKPLADVTSALPLSQCRQTFTLMPVDNIIGLALLPLQPCQLNNGISTQVPPQLSGIELNLVNPVPPRFTSEIVQTASGSKSQLDLVVTGLRE